MLTKYVPVYMLVYGLVYMVIFVSQLCTCCAVYFFDCLFENC